MHVVEEGEGHPLVLLHGLPGDYRLLHHHLEPVLAARTGWRRLYIDLPGMGRTPGADWIHRQADVRDIALETIDALVGRDQSFGLVGVSYGGFMAMAVLQQRLSRVDGLFLWTPALAWGSGTSHGVEHRLFEQDPQIIDAVQPDEQIWTRIAVVQTPSTLEAFRAAVKPAAALADIGYLRRLQEEEPETFDATVLPGVFEAPTLILAARYDTAVGYRPAIDVYESFPRATLAVLDRAGHAVAEERKPLFRALVADWLDRMEAESRTS